MKLDNGKVEFGSYSEYNSLIIWLKKKSKRIIPNEPHEIIEGKLYLKVEDIPKNPPRPKQCMKFLPEESNSQNQSNVLIIDFNVN
jgi:hypothetical protein